MQEDIEQPHEDDYDYSSVPRDNTNILAELKVVVTNLWRAQRRREKIDNLLKEAKAAELQLREKIVPEVMLRGGAACKEITIEVEPGTSFRVVLVEDHVSAKMSEGRKDIIFKWFKENGYENLIGSNIVIPFTKGQEQELASFMAHMEKYEKKEEISIANVESIHSSTYTSICKKLVAAKKLDEQQQKDFGIHVKTGVELVAPKSKRKTTSEEF